MTGWGRCALAGVAMALAAVVFVPPAVGESTPEWKCNAITDIPPDERIAACTAVLDSGKYGRQGARRAYFNRADAYNKKREFQRAAADYSALIDLNPENRFVYAFRAYSYFQLGELDRAIADYDRTIEQTREAATPISIAAWPTTVKETMTMPSPTTTRRCS